MVGLKNKSNFDKATGVNFIILCRAEIHQRIKVLNFLLILTSSVASGCYVVMPNNT